MLSSCPTSGVCFEEIGTFNVLLRTLLQVSPGRKQRKRPKTLAASFSRSVSEPASSDRAQFCQEALLCT